MRFLKMFVDLSSLKVYYRLPWIVLKGDKLTVGNPLTGAVHIQGRISSMENDHPCLRNGDVISPIYRSSRK